MLFVLVTLAFVGLLGMSYLFPLAAIFFFKIRPAPKITTQPKQISSFAILVPVYNEQDTLRRTLASIRRACEYAQGKDSSLRFRVFVGADCCSDSSVDIARSFDVEVLDYRERHGKLKIIRKLSAFAKEYDWLVLADAGVLWPFDFFEKLIPTCSESSVIGVGPSYTNPIAGQMEILHWTFERGLKWLETFAGGPISMHGATSLYRTTEFLEAQKHLSEEGWLNDDVVFPLLVRSLNPNKRIVYAPNVVVQEQIRLGALAPSHGREMVRRLRMAIGNAQWVSLLLPRVFKTDLVIGIICLRRVFRLFWAYWLMFAGAALLLGAINNFAGWLVLSFVLLAGVVTIAAYHRNPPIAKAMEAALASLLAPYYMFQFFRRPPYESEVVADWR